MSEQLRLERPTEEPSNPLRPRRRRWPLLRLFVVLALAGAGGVYTWANMGPLIQSFARETTDDTADPGDKPAIPDLLAIQQKASEDLEALSKVVAGQQEQLKIILEQLAALTSKVDALQRPAPAQIPPSAVALAPTPIAQAAAKPKKPARPRTPKPAGPISTGGAPLDAAPDGSGR
jgi:uncharacterized coiled-coil protein SlyX